MKSIIVVVVLVFATSALAQQSSSQGRVSSETYRAEIAKAIARYPNGETLFRKSDLFERMIERYVGLKLGLIQEDGDLQGTAQASFEPLANSVSEVDISRTGSDENEPSIAISRSNPNLFVGGANDGAMYSRSMPVYYSSNAGKNWTTYRLPPVKDSGCQAAGDPIIVGDGTGGFYYAFMLVSPHFGSGEPFLSDFMVAHSTDGKTWTLGSPVVGNTTPDFSLEDKETIAVDVDPASPYHGRVYIAWRHFADLSGGGSGGGDYELLSYSDDQGQSWSPPEPQWSNFIAIALLRVGKDGTVFLAGSGTDTVTLATGHGMRVSHDGGKTFKEYPIADYTDYPVSSILIRGTLKGDAGFRAFPYIAFDLDPATNMLFAAYGNYEDAGFASEYIVTSTNEGMDWSLPQQIGTPSLIATDHFFPWVSFDPVLKRAFVTLYSSEDDPVNNIKSRAVRAELGSLGTMLNLGSAPFNPTSLDASGDPFVGDYIASDASGGTFVAAWTETRAKGHDGDIYVYISSPSGSGVTSAINAVEFSASEPFPNPSLGRTTTIRLNANAPSRASVRLIDLNGRESLLQTVELLPGEESVVNLDLHALAAGVYRAIIAANGQSLDRSIVVLR